MGNLELIDGLDSVKYFFAYEYTFYIPEGSFSVPEGIVSCTERYSLLYPKVLLRSSNPIKNNLKVHLQNSQWQRSHGDWTERPEASKENFRLDGRSSFQEKYSLKEAPPVLKLALILLNI